MKQKFCTLELLQSNSRIEIRGKQAFCFHTQTFIPTPNLRESQGDGSIFTTTKNTGTEILSFRAEYYNAKGEIFHFVEDVIGDKMETSEARPYLDQVNEGMMDGIHEAMGVTDCYSDNFNFILGPMNKKETEKIIVHLKTVETMQVIDGKWCLVQPFYLFKSLEEINKKNEILICSPEKISVETDAYVNNCIMKNVTKDLEKMDDGQNFVSNYKFSLNELPKVNVAEAPSDYSARLEIRIEAKSFGEDSWLENWSENENEGKILSMTVLKSGIVEQMKKKGVLREKPKSHKRFLTIIASRTGSLNGEGIRNLIGAFRLLANDANLNDGRTKMRIITYGRQNWKPQNLIPRLANGSEWFVPQKDFAEIDVVLKTMEANLGRPFIRETLLDCLQNQTDEADKNKEAESERIFFVIGDQNFGWKEEEDKDKQDLAEIVREKVQQANGKLRINPICIAPSMDGPCWGELAAVGNGMVTHFKDKERFREFLTSMIPHFMNNEPVTIVGAEIVNKMNPTDKIEIISGPGQKIKKLWTDENLRKLIYEKFVVRHPRDTDEMKVYFEEYVNDDMTQLMSINDDERISFHFIQGAAQSDLSQYELKLTWNDNIHSSHSIPIKTAEPSRNSRRLHNTQQVRWLAAKGLSYQGQRQFCVHTQVFMEQNAVFYANKQNNVGPPPPADPNDVRHLALMHNFQVSTGYAPPSEQPSFGGFGGFGGFGQRQRPKPKVFGIKLELNMPWRRQRSDIFGQLITKADENAQWENAPAEPAFMIRKRSQFEELSEKWLDMNEEQFAEFQKNFEFKDDHEAISFLIWTCFIYCEITERGIWSKILPQAVNLHGEEKFDRIVKETHRYLLEKDLWKRYDRIWPTKN